MANLYFLLLFGRLFLVITAQFFAAILVIVALSVAATVVVLQCHHHDPRGAKMPKWVSVFSNKVFMVKLH